MWDSVVEDFVMILSMGILSFSIFGTHKILGILSQVNFSLGDFVAGIFCHGGFDPIPNLTG